MAAIEVRGLTKSYGDLVAVDGVDISVEIGEVFALLGPNGAGKTTTVEILEGHRSADGGSISVLGFDPSTGGRAYRERIGIVLQEGAVERELSVREALSIYGGMYPRRLDADHLIDLVGLTEKAGARIKTLSGGQQRRLELALGLVGDPDLLFLDEPTTGFDPSARRQAWGILENLADLGKTILLTTHYMDEAQHLADRIAIIDGGKIVAEGTPETLGGRADGKSMIRFALPEGVSFEDLPITASTVDGDMVEVSAESATRALHELTTWAIDKDLELEQLQVARPSLEDVYLELTDEH
ncbi:MAG TPA: ABC transporter ATP-binding protein [Acidimicrobiia bacterium]|nr:ABC transporter ATP-binding protein [Acidimicrobiia bacterium]